MLQMIKQRVKEERGLTLVELLAVLVILGIVAAVSIPIIGNIIDNSKYGAIKSDGIQYINAARMFEADNGELPTTKDQLKGYVEGDTSIKDKPFIFKKNDDGAIQFTGEGATEDGKITVTFTEASIRDINKADKKYVKGGMKIPNK